MLKQSKKKFSLKFMNRYFIISLFLQNLEDKERKNTVYKEQLNRERRYLRRRLEQLSSYHKRRSVSECSSSTVSSSHSTTSHSSAPSPISETGMYKSKNVFSYIFKISS